MGTVYLLHFTHPYKHAKHYIGYANQLLARLEHHRNGTGARLLQVIRDAGLDFQLVRTWSGDKNLERRLKNRKDAPRLCPICSPARAHQQENGNDAEYIEPEIGMVAPIKSNLIIPETTPDY